MDYYKYIMWIAQFSSLIPVAAGMIRYKSLPKSAKVFFYFMIFSACTEAIAYFLARVYNNSMPFLYIYTFVEFIIFSYILLPRLLLFANNYKPILISLTVLMFGLLLLDVHVHSIYKMNTISMVTKCILIVFMGLAYLLQYIRSDNTIKITHDYVFWIASGATLYFAVAFFFFTTYNLLQETDLVIPTKSFHALASTSSYLLFTIGFWVIPKKRTPTP